MAAVKLEKKLEEASSSGAAVVGDRPRSAARLAAAAARVAPSFNRSFSPRKKLVL